MYKYMFKVFYKSKSTLNYVTPVILYLFNYFKMDYTYQILNIKFWFRNQTNSVKLVFRIHKITHLLYMI